MVRSLVLLATLTYAASAFEWKPYSGTFPEGALEFFPRVSGRFYCRIQEGGESYVGSVGEDGKECLVAETKTDVLASSTFDVLTKKADEEYDWKYCAVVPPTQAITCDAEVSNSGSCHLGQSVYSDAICDEDIGYIKDGIVHMVVGGEVSRCPFKLYLVKGAADPAEKC